MTIRETIYRSVMGASKIQSFFQVFKVDLSQPSGTAQTFMFVTPIMGQYIRISPLNGVPGSDNKCLKFELIGCLYKGKSKKLYQ